LLWSQSSRIESIDSFFGIIFVMLFILIWVKSQNLKVISKFMWTTFYFLEGIIFKWQPPMHVCLFIKNEVSTLPACGSHWIFQHWWPMNEWIFWRCSLWTPCKKLNIRTVYGLDQSEQIWKTWDTQFVKDILVHFIKYIVSWLRVT